MGCVNMFAHFVRKTPQWKVIEGYRPGVIRAILNEQREVVEKYQAYPHLINPYRVIVLEDCATYLTWDKTIEELSAMARHLKISVYVITQHPQKLLPIVRSNADVAVIFRLHSDAALECLGKDYLPGLDKDEAKEVLTSFVWKDRNKVSQALIIVNREGNTLQERLFTLTAPDPGPFRIGCREYWHKQQSVPSWEELARIDADIKENGYHGLTTLYVDDQHGELPYAERPIVRGPLPKDDGPKPHADGLEVVDYELVLKRDDELAAPQTRSTTKKRIAAASTSKRKKNA